MYVLLNGSFGIGKSRVARALQRVVTDSLIANPEWIGVLLQRAARRHRSDFQHDPVWRRLTVAWARLLARFSSTVIIPMTFTDLRYLEEVCLGLAKDRQPVLHFCLTAPLEVVRARLAERGEPITDEQWTWVHRRAAECCTAHTSPAFAEHVATFGRQPEVIATFLATRLRDTAT